MDLQLPGISGIEATRELCQEDDSAKILMFTTFARDDEILAAIEAGASGYLQKSSSREELITAIRSLHSGETYFASEISQRIEGLQSGPSITVREREILTLIAQGQANKEIAAALGIAEDTVKRHASNIFQKFSVSDRAEATAEAIRRGIVKVDP
jgi:DNA-binding NarL/FixJ family response regulator